MWQAVHAGSSVGNGAYGTVMVFPGTAPGFYKVFGVETTQGVEDMVLRTNCCPGRRIGLRPGPGGDWEVRMKEILSLLWQAGKKVYEEPKELNPDYKQITVFKGSATGFFNRLGNQRTADRYTFNPRSGEITGAKFYIRMLTLQEKSVAGYSPSGVGSWGGLTTRILSFPAAVGRLAADGLLSLICRLIRKGSRKGIYN